MLNVFETPSLAQAEPGKIGSLPLNLQKLICQLSQTKSCSPAQVKAYIQGAHITPADLMHWADFAHPVTESYGRKLLFHGGHFEIMVMSWAPGDYSAIHDHGSARWGAVQCFGAAEHYIYAYRHGLLTTLKAAHYTPHQIHSVDHSLIHQMGNPSDQPLLSLHVYGCTSSRQMITGDARLFDLLEGSTQFTDGGVFFCLDGLDPGQIKRQHFGLRGDAATTLRHHHHMGDRLRRILSDTSGQLQGLDRQRLAQKLGRLERSIEDFR